MAFQKLSPLAPMTKTLDAPAHTLERESLNVIAESLKFIEEAKAYQEQAKLLPHNVIRERYEIETSVLDTLGKGGKLVNDAS